MKLRAEDYLKHFVTGGLDAHTQRLLVRHDAFPFGFVTSAAHAAVATLRESGEKPEYCCW